MDKALVREAQIRSTGANNHRVSQQLAIYCLSTQKRYATLHQMAETKLRSFVATGVISLAAVLSLVDWDELAPLLLYA